MKTQHFTIQNIYIILSVILPVLSIYVSPIPGIDLGTACILVFGVIMLMSSQSFHMYGLLSLILLYSFVVSIPAISGGAIEYSSSGAVLVRLMRFIILSLLMIGCGYANYYNEQKYTKVLGVASLIVAGYAILQSIVFRFMGIKLRNIFGKERGGAVFSAALGQYEDVYRPPSFFLEPSAVTYFLTPFLCYILFRSKKMNYKDFLVAAVLTIGILVSTSGQGLLVIALCWGIWGITQIKSRNIAGIIIAALCAVLFFKNFDMEYSLSRITTEDELNAVDARSGGYDMVKELSGTALLFGNGYGNYDETIYYSSFAEILFCTGIIGLALVILFYAILFIKGIRYQRVLVLASLILMLGGGIYTATYLCLYLPLLLSRGRYSDLHS
ncbi:MAG: hypothetical protein J5699_01155 [Bacteroidales bacterium]|nr:hypothetical protein [Bacteroidales bacterium]